MRQYPLRDKALRDAVVLRDEHCLAYRRHMERLLEVMRGAASAQNHQEVRTLTQQSQDLYSNCQTFHQDVQKRLNNLLDPVLLRRLKVITVDEDSVVVTVWRPGMRPSDEQTASPKGGR